MYETEANNKLEEANEIPAEVLKKFREFREHVSARTLLPWGEHCTECVWPTCYTSCDLFSPREDGRCRRFVDGMVRVDCSGSATRYLLKIRFKRWGKLWTPGNVRLFSTAQADRRETVDQSIGSRLYQLPVPAAIRKFATTKRYNWKKRLAVKGRPSHDTPDVFVVECYNPGVREISLSLTMRPSDSQFQVPYQKLIQISPGFHRECIPVEEIGRVLNLDAQFSVDLIPNEIPDDTPLFFGLLDFVRSAVRPGTKVEQAQKVKCIVWDLDNTLWSGVLVEDGPEKLTLMPGIVDVIKELDRRGILHSVASKNDHDEAMAVLRLHGLDDYFLHPQISWGPKSEALKAIAKKLNIGIDTLLLIDDSDFELAQVQSACPSVKVLLADRYRELPELPECKVALTAESSHRRKMYQEESVREHAEVSFEGDYFTFLRDCKLETQIERLSATNIKRVHELTQRTNQMNFSGNRYELRMLEQIAATPHLDAYVISCRDRFGSYGIVGFSVVDSRVPRMIDLAFSCRVQSKRVEHAFLAYLLKKYIDASGKDFWADYRKTPRNAPSGRVFQDIGMEEVGEHDGVTSLVFRHDRNIPDDCVVLIVDEVSTAPSLPAYV
jgi:FkbH-like protein